jgi:hypothetical protein
VSRRDQMVVNCRCYNGVHDSRELHNCWWCGELFANLGRIAEGSAGDARTSDFSSVMNNYSVLCII